MKIAAQLMFNWLKAGTYFNKSVYPNVYVTDFKANYQLYLVNGNFFISKSGKWNTNENAKPNIYKCQNLSYPGCSTESQNASPPRLVQKMIFKKIK